MTSSLARHAESRWYQFYQLTKPRVVSLIVFCAVIGMFLAVPPAWSPRLQPLSCGAPSASRWSRARRRRSIAWSSRKSMR